MILEIPAQVFEIVIGTELGGGWDGLRYCGSADAVVGSQSYI